MTKAADPGVRVPRPRGEPVWSVLDRPSSRRNTADIPGGLLRHRDAQAIDSVTAIDGSAREPTGHEACRDTQPHRSRRHRPGPYGEAAQDGLVVHGDTGGRRQCRRSLIPLVRQVQPHRGHLLLRSRARWYSCVVVARDCGPAQAHVPRRKATPGVDGAANELPELLMSSPRRPSSPRRGPGRRRRTGRACAGRSRRSSPAPRPWSASARPPPPGWRR